MKRVRLDPLHRPCPDFAVALLRTEKTFRDFSRIRLTFGAKHGIITFAGGSSSVVERRLAKAKAAGSNPVFRSKQSRAVFGGPLFVFGGLVRFLKVDV